jgi:hypothetical protein
MLKQYSSAIPVSLSVGGEWRPGAGSVLYHASNSRLNFNAVRKGFESR